MSRTKRRIHSPEAPDRPVRAALLSAGLLTSMLMGPLSATHAQDTATPAGQTVTRSQTAAARASASQGSQASAASQPASGSPSSPSQGASDASPPGGNGSQTSANAAAPSRPNAAGSSQPDGDKAPGKPAAVCFKLTGHCVEGSRSTAAKGSAAAGPAKGGSAAPRPLNLNAPDVRTVVSAEELKEPLPSDGQITETQEADTVSVKAESDAPDVPGGFGALWWALNHPSQAWRIVAPAE